MGGTTEPKSAVSRMESRGIAVGYDQRDREFLDGIFLAFPEMRNAFEACSKVNPLNRFHYIREQMKTFERQVWADVGIPEGRRETLSKHVSQMAAFACENPLAPYDLRDALAIVALWGMPKAIVNETPLDLMPRERRNVLENLAARMIMLDQKHQGDFALWEKLREAPMLSNKYNNDPTVASWVHDIDHIVTALKARDYQAQYPDKNSVLETLVDNCRQALLTPEAKNLWSDTVRRAPEIVRSVTIDGNIGIVPHASHIPPHTGTGTFGTAATVHAPEVR